MMKEYNNVEIRKINNNIIYGIIKDKQKAQQLNES